MADNEIKEKVTTKNTKKDKLTYNCVRSTFNNQLY